MHFTKLLSVSILAGIGTLTYAAEPVIGLITKTETNPFFVKMKEGAQQAAKASVIERQTVLPWVNEAPAEFVPLKRHIAYVTAR